MHEGVGESTMLEASTGGKVVNEATAVMIKSWNALARIIYQSWNVLMCPLHALAYEIECNYRADNAAEIIDPELGRGHSNACEETLLFFLNSGRRMLDCISRNTKPPAALPYSSLL